MPRQVVIACSVRPDNRGGANASDMQALLACQQLFSQTITVDDHEELAIKIVVRKVPAVESAGDATALQGARTDVLRRGARSELAGVDLLYIPGAPVAAATQATDTHKMKATSGFKQAEAISRDAFESALIEAAMTLGIPVLAVCAGSWRLLEAFGGSVRELSGQDVARHYENGWNCHHALVVHPKGNGLLADAARNSGSRGLEFSGANSTHWAVAKTTDAGKLAKHGAATTLASRTIPAPVLPETRPLGLTQNAKKRWNAREAKRVSAETQANLERHAATPGRVFRDPGALLHVLVKEGSMARQGTVEGFESASGAPVVGVQWHPESFLPGMKGHGESYKNVATVAFSQNIFMNMVLAALASQTRRTNAIPALKEAFGKTSMGLRKVAEQDKNYRVDRYAPGDVG